MCRTIKILTAEPCVEESNEEITSDISRDSLLPEQLPEALHALESIMPISPRTIQSALKRR